MNEKECCICFEELKKRFKLNCGHDQFHKKCVLSHFKPECPICRQPHSFKIKGVYEPFYEGYEIESYSDMDISDLFICFETPEEDSLLDSEDSELVEQNKWFPTCCLPLFL